MTSPYTSSLLQDPIRPSAPGTRVDAVARPTAAPSRSVTHVHPAPMMQPMQPQVVYVAAPNSGTRVAPLMLAVIVIALGVVALFAGYLAAEQAAPTPGEAQVTQQLAATDGFFTGRQRGEALGRAAGYERASQIAALKSGIATQRAWNQGWARGVKLGTSSYRPEPTWSGGYGGYSGYRGYRGSYGGGAVAGALYQAQGLANMTGSPVDVEVY